MGLRGQRSNPAPNRHLNQPQSSDDLVITPEALAIYRQMRRHERQQDGPGGPEWWQMNARLADCFGL